MTSRLLAGFLLGILPSWCQDAAAEVRQRIEIVRRMPGFAALWDFALREDGTGGRGRFIAHQPRGAKADLALDAVNYVRDYWNRGREATYEDFPVRPDGPFGQSIRIRRETDPDFRPVLLVPRERLHDSAIDAKGMGRSVSMVVWLIRESGNHALAGIWHEGTDLQSAGGPVTRVESGRRQYASFAGLAANNGASAVHLSENGASSFGDKYARNLAVTPEHIPTVPADSDSSVLNRSWSTVGFVFDNARNTVRAYLNGMATDYWIEDGLSGHPFFRWPYNGWTQAELRRQPGLQPGEDPDFPPEQFYTPPEWKPLSRRILSETGGERMEIQEFQFTRVRVILGKDERGRFSRVLRRELVALRVNPFWFAHDIHAPPTPADGGPFTIGRVIHTGRSVGFTGWIGGVAVFNRALSPKQMKRLAGFVPPTG